MKKLICASLLLLAACGTPKDAVKTYLDASVSREVDTAQPLNCFPEQYNNDPLRTMQSYTITKDEPIERNGVSIRSVTITAKYPEGDRQFEVWQLTPEGIKTYELENYKRAISRGLNPIVSDSKISEAPQCVVVTEIK